MMLSFPGIFLRGQDRPGRAERKRSAGHFRPRCRSFLVRLLLDLQSAWCGLLQKDIIDVPIALASITTFGRSY